MITEAQLLSEVLAICRENTILASHSYDSRRDYGRGFPDLVMAGKYSVLFAELKANGGTFSPEQIDWKYRLIGCGATYISWTPRDLESGVIEATLINL
jgi:hypothetical protein